MFDEHWREPASVPTARFDHAADKNPIQKLDVAQAEVGKERLVAVRGRRRVDCQQAPSFEIEEDPASESIDIVEQAFCDCYRGRASSACHWLGVFQVQTRT